MGPFEHPALLHSHAAPHGQHFRSLATHKAFDKQHKITSTHSPARSKPRGVTLTPSTGSKFAGVLAKRGKRVVLEFLQQTLQQGDCHETVH